MSEVILGLARELKAQTKQAQGGGQPQAQGWGQQPQGQPQQQGDPWANSGDTPPF